MKKRKVFVIGDSVSIHYGPYLKKLIEGNFDYDRKRGISEALIDLDKPVGANAGDSKMVLEYLKDEKEKNTRYDILLINCGLHDIRVDRVSNKIQTGLEEYTLNLNGIIEIAKTMANKIIWVGLTPVIDKIHNSRKEGYLRYSKDSKAYDIAAKEIMLKHNIKVIDMYNLTKGLGENIYCDHVHFNDDIRGLQAAFIAGELNFI